MRIRAGTLDALLRGGVLLLVVATPLALGSTSVASQAAFEVVTLALGTLWLLRCVWFPPSRAGAGCAAAESSPGGPADRARLHLGGHRLVRTGLGLPILLFMSLVALQLAPLPSSIVKRLSPAAYRLQESSLPGLTGGGEVDFARTGSFLLGSEGDDLVETILDAPGEAPPGLEARGSRLRPISIYPYATAARLVLLCSLLLLFAVSLHVFPRRSQVDRFFKAVVFLGFALAIFGIVQRLSWNGKVYWILPVDPAASPFGPFVNHNHFAALLVMIVPIAIGLLMDEARGVLSGGGGRKLLTAIGAEPFARLLLASFVVGVMASAVVLSASRGALFALVAALLVHGGVLAARGRIGRPEAATALALVALALGLSLWLGLGPLAAKLRVLGEVESEPSITTRLLGWRTTLDIVASSPLMGTGLGTFPQAWKHHYPMGTAAVWHEAHNDYLQLLAESGGVGFALFAAALAIFVWRHLRPRALGSAARRSDAELGAVTGILAIALHSIVDFPLQILGCSTLFVVLSAIVASRRDPEEALT